MSHRHEVNNGTCTESLYVPGNFIIILISIREQLSTLCQELCKVPYVHNAMLPLTVTLQTAVISPIYDWRSWGSERLKQLGQGHTISAVDPRLTFMFFLLFQVYFEIHIHWRSYLEPLFEKVFLSLLRVLDNGWHLSMSMYILDVSLWLRIKLKV